MPGRVACPDHHDRPLATPVGFELCRRVVHAVAREGLLLGKAERTVAGTGGEDHAPAAHDRLVIEVNGKHPILAPEPDCLARHRDTGAKLDRLHLGQKRQVSSRDPGREAEVVFDAGGGPGLPADSEVIDDDR